MSLPGRESQTLDEAAVKASKSSIDAPRTSNRSSAVQNLLTNDESLINHVTTREEFDNLKNIVDKFVIVWFSATWCKPCINMTAKFEELAIKYQTKIEIWKIDVDKFEDLAMENDVSMMPSYVIMRNGEKLDFYMGSKPEYMEELIDKYLEEKPE